MPRVIARARHVSSFTAASLASPLHCSLAFIAFDMPSITRRIRSTLTSDALATRMRQGLSNGITSDAFDATQVALKAIQASADACLPLKSGVSVALVLLEMSEVSLRTAAVFSNSF